MDRWGWFRLIECGGCGGFVYRLPLNTVVCMPPTLASITKWMLGNLAIWPRPASPCELTLIDIQVSILELNLPASLLIIAKARANLCTLDDFAKSQCVGYFQPCICCWVKFRLWVEVLVLSKA